METFGFLTSVGFLRGGACVVMRCLRKPSLQVKIQHDCYTMTHIIIEPVLFVLKCLSEANLAWWARTKWAAGQGAFRPKFWVLATRPTQWTFKNNLKRSGTIGLVEFSHGKFVVRNRGGSFLNNWANEPGLPCWWIKLTMRFIYPFPWKQQEAFAGRKVLKVS